MPQISKYAVCVLCAVSFTLIAASQGTDIFVALEEIAEQHTSFRSMPELRNDAFLIDSNIVYVPNPSADEAFPAIAFDGINHLAVWEDNRNGNWDICGTRVSQSGVVLDTAGIEIADFSGSSDQQAPAIAFDGTSFLVVWQDHRNGDWDIYGARLSQSGTVLDSHGIVISNNPYEQRYPAVSFDGTNYCVVWEDDRSGDWDVYGARVDQNGIVLDTAGIAIAVGASGQFRPSITFGNAEHMVAWHTGDNYVGGEIWCARVTPSGEVLDSLGIVVTGVACRSTSISFDGTNYFVVWHTLHSETMWDVNGARVSQSGVVLDSDIFLLSQSDYPVIAFDGTNYLVIGARLRSQIQGVRVSQAGVILDTTRITVSVEGRERNYPAIIFDGMRYLVVWDDTRSEFSQDIFGARVDTSGVVLDSAGLPVSVSYTAYHQDEPAVVYCGSEYLVAWQDFRNYSLDLYGARVTNTGDVLDEQGIAISTQIGTQAHPCAAFGGAHSFVIWDRPTRGARVNQSGVVLDTAGIEIHGGDRPAIAFDGTNYLVVGQSWRWSWESYHYDIYGRLIDQSGNILDSFFVETGIEDWSFHNPAVAFDGTNYLVVYEVYQGGYLACKRVNMAGEVIESEAVVVNWSVSRNPSITFDGTNYLVVWHSGQPGGGDIYGARVTQAAVVLDTNEIQICYIPGTLLAMPSVAFDGNDFVVVWQESRNSNWDIYGARVSQSGQAGSSFAVCQEPSDQVSPDIVHGSGNQVFITYSGWVDSINGNPAQTMRIWGMLADNLGIEEAARAGEIVAEYGLHVSPNPFGKRISISCQISNSKARLAIYDVTGRLVKNFVLRSQHPYHQICWDGTDDEGTKVPGGVYFVQLHTGDNVERRKVVFIK